MTAPAKPSAAAGAVVDLARVQLALSMASAVQAMLDASAALNDATEAILKQLDQMQGDPDLEPVLGAAEAVAGLRLRLNQEDWAEGGDRDEREADDGDLEPSLGSLGSCRQPITQERWAGHPSPSDLEAEHDGREPECEDEGAQCDDEGVDADSEPTTPAWFPTMARTSASRSVRTGVWSGSRDDRRAGADHRLERHRPVCWSERGRRSAPRGPR